MGGGDRMEYVLFAFALWSLISYGHKFPPVFLYRYFFFGEGGVFLLTCKC